MTTTATPLALRLFTDRDEPREVLRRFFLHIKDGTCGASNQARPVLSFFGVGGVGKSTLLAKALDDFAAAERADLHELEQRHLRAVLVNLDNDLVTPEIGVERVMVCARNSLNAQGIVTPHFDHLYSLWASDGAWGQGTPLQADLSAKGSGLNDQLAAWDVVSRLAAFFGEAMPGAKTVREALAGLSNRYLGWVQHSRLPGRFKDGLPIGWPQAQRLERMSAVLGLDLLEAVDRQPQIAVCLVVDGFERIQSHHNTHDAQWAFQSLVAEVLACADTLPEPDGKPIKGRIGFLLLGREKLRWAELYGNEIPSVDWERKIEEHLELCGLSEADARAFLLDKVVPHERAEGHDRVARLLCDHTDALLAAACERLPSREPSYLPYYLDLGAGLVRNSTASFDPAELGSTPGELQRRFIRHSLSPAHRATFRAFALALEFDLETFAFLLDEKLLAGFTRHDFDALVGDDWSFVIPLPSGRGLYRFHRHMQAALLKDQTGRREDRAKAANVFRALHARQSALVAFATPADCRSAQLAAFDLAAAQLREVAAYRNDSRAPTLLPPEEIVAEVLVLNSHFDSKHHVARRRPLLQWLVGLARDELRSEHPAALSSMSNLARTLQAQGDLPDARALLVMVLAARRRVLGEEHPDTLVSMGNLASTLRAQGDLPGARTLEEAVLIALRRVRGEEHPATLSAMSNLASTLQAQGDLPGARALEEAVPAALRRVLGEEHPDTLSSMGNLAMTLRALGDLPGARALEEPVLAARRRVLGDEHPDTFTSMNNLASTLWAQGDLPGARALLEAVLTARRRVLGEEHPETLSSMGNLAVTLRALGDLPGARALEESVLAACRRVLGEEHPDTLTSMNNLALTIQAQGDLPGARALGEAALAALRRVLGEEHPDTLTSMNNLALTIQAQGDLPGARALQEALLVTRRRVMGEEHPDTLNSMNNLAGTLWRQGDLPGARALQEVVLATHRQVLGENNLITSRSAWNLFSTLQDLGERKAADEVLESHLQWLIDRDPADLPSADQRTIRNYVCQALGLDPDATR